MEMRRFAAIVAIIVFALGSYSYLISKYNPDTVELYIKENIPFKGYEKIRQDNRGVIFNINYIMRFKDSRLIMTTGMDYLVKELKLSKGSFMADMNIKEAAIGDTVASENFRSSNVTGQLINIYGEEYKIAGIIKGSNEVYIPYSDKLSSLTWQKRIIRCNINDKKHFYLKLEELQNQLEALGVEVLDVVTYREEMNAYRNIAVLFIIYILSYYLLILIRRIRAGLAKLWKEYLENSRTIELYAYMLNKAREISVAMCCSLIGLTMLYVIYKLLSNLYIPPSMIPDNLFSPSSYMNVARWLYRKCFVRLENGVNGILIDIKILNTIFIIFVLSMITIMHKYVLYGKNIKPRFWQLNTKHRSDWGKIMKVKSYN